MGIADESGCSGKAMRLDISNSGIHDIVIGNNIGSRRVAAGVEIDQFCAVHYTALIKNIVFYSPVRQADIGAIEMHGDRLDMVQADSGIIHPKQVVHAHPGGIHIQAPRLGVPRP